MKSRLRARRRALTCFWLWKARDRDLTCEPRHGGCRWERGDRWGDERCLQGERQKAAIRTTSVWQKLLSDQPKNKISQIALNANFVSRFSACSHFYLFFCWIFGKMWIFPWLHKQAVSQRKIRSPEQCLKPERWQGPPPTNKATAVWNCVVL